MWIEYNPNPNGKRVGDCTIRAISKLTGKSWEDVYAGLTVQGFLYGDMPSSNSVWGGYLQRLGYKRYVVPNTCPNCYTVRDFCADHPNGAYLLVLNGHVVTCISGNYYDTWNSGDEVPQFYWTKERVKNGV